MQTQVGVIKQISGLVVAVDQNGVSRVLKVGDALYLGEVVKTSSASSKAVVSMDNGKDVTILGDESLKLDENVAAGEKPNTVADVSDLQKALLNGEDLTKLEETAAGGNAAAAGGGDGVSLGAASFDEGGHYSNINENFRSIGDLNSARGAERIGGVSGAADNAGGDAGFVDTTIPTVTLDPINNTSTVVTGKVPNPDPNTTVTVEIPGHTPVTVPVNPDGTFSVPTPNNEPLKPGTEVKVTPKDDAGNGTPVTTPVSDVVPPQVDLTPKADGTVEVVPHDNDATKVEISYTDNGGNTQTITVVKNPSAGWVVDSTPGKTTAPTGAFKLDPHSGKVTISDNATKDNTPVTAKATDGAGNTATGETTAPDKFTIKFNDDADGNGTITRGENYAEDGAKATVTISIPNLAKDGSKIHVIGTGINDYYTVHKDASGNVTSVIDTKGNNVFDGDGIKVSYDYSHYQTALGNAASITVELEGTTLKATSSVKFENVGKAEVKFVELDEHGNVLNEKSDQITNQNRNTAMLDGDINHTTARISLPENVQDGDVVTVKYGYGPSAASLAATGGTDTTAYKYFLVHKASDGSMTVDQITSADDKTPIKAGLTSTNGAGEKFGIDIHDMPTTTYNHTHSRGIEVTVKGDDHADKSSGDTWIFRDSMEAPKVEFIEGNKVYDPSVSGSGSGALNAGISVADAIKDGDISHTTARITLPKVFSDGDKLTVAITDYNKIYADTGVKQYPANNPEPTFVKAFIIHKAADGTVTFDEVDAAGNVTHAGIQR